MKKFLDLIIENFKNKNQKAFIIALFAEQKKVKAAICLEFLSGEILRILIKNNNQMASLIRIRWIQDELQNPGKTTEIGAALNEILKFIKEEQIELLLLKATNMLYENDINDFDIFYNLTLEFFLQKNIIYFSLFKFKNTKRKNIQLTELSSLEANKFLNEHKENLSHLTSINEAFLKQQMIAFSNFNNSSDFQMPGLRSSGNTNPTDSPLKMKNDVTQQFEFSSHFKRKYLMLTRDTSTPLKYVKFIFNVIFN